MSGLLIHLAVALLPRHLRDRYREQWSGELRDAPELGLRTSGIALGAVALAITLDRPWPWRVRERSGADRRSRRAIALSLSAAVVAVTQYAGWIGSIEPTRIWLVDYLVFVGSMLLIGYLALAPVVALVLALTKGVTSRTRIAVILLVAASIVPLFQDSFAADIVTDDPFLSLFVSVGMVASLIAALLIVAAGALLWSDRRRVPAPDSPERSRRRRLQARVGGLVVLGVVALGFAESLTRWASRMPLVFGDPLDESNRAVFEQWVTLKVLYEHDMSTVFALWLILGVVTAVAIILFGSLVPRPTLLAAGVLAVAAVVHGSIANLLSMTPVDIDPVIPTVLLLLGARCALIAVVFRMFVRVEAHEPAVREILI